MTRPTAADGLGFSHKWNLGWMHDTLDYLTFEPVHRKFHHNEMTFALLYAYDERFVLPLSHDEVVHGKGSLLSKMGGDDWQRFAALRALYAWQWSMPGASLMFMGSELAPWQEWNHNAELPWHLLEHPSHRGVHDLVRDAQPTADEWPALWCRDTDPGGFQWLDADDAAHSLYAFIRWGAGGASAVACIANFTPVPRPGYRVGLPWAGDWTVRRRHRRRDLVGQRTPGRREHRRHRRRRAVAVPDVVGDARHRPDVDDLDRLHLARLM